VPREILRGVRIKSPAVDLELVANAHAREAARKRGVKIRRETARRLVLRHHTHSYARWNLCPAALVRSLCSFRVISRRRNCELMFIFSQ
jgi:hypothetical protein